MFGFKPIITGSPVTISSDGLKPTRFDSISKASTSTGIPYGTLLYIKKNSKDRVRSNGKEYEIIFHQLRGRTATPGPLRGPLMPHSNLKDRAYEFNTGVGKCPCGQTFEYTSERDMKMKLRKGPTGAHDHCTTPCISGSVPIFQKVSIRYECLRNLVL